jgi:hypothetical protein
MLYDYVVFIGVISGFFSFFWDETLFFLLRALHACSQRLHKKEKGSWLVFFFFLFV